MRELLGHLFDTSGFIPRRYCGEWSTQLLYLHTVSDTLIWLAYLAIPVVLIWFIRRRRDVPFHATFWMFGLFIVSCGFTHLLEVIIFFTPIYRLTGVVKLVTAVSSWATVGVLIPTIPRALALRSPREFEREIAERERAEQSLRASEERTRLLVECVRDYAIVALDPQGRITSWNGGAEIIKGYEAHEIVGRHYSLFSPPEDVASGKPDRDLVAAAAEGRFEEEGWRTRKDGSLFFANVVITPVRDHVGALVGFAWVTRDITERKLIDDRLQQQADLLNLAHDGIIVRDLEGRVHYWYPGAVLTYGWTAEEASGIPTHDLLRTEFPRPLEEINAALLRDAYWEGELVHTRRDGSRIVVESRWAARRDDSGRVETVLEINRDVTDRKNAQEALRESEERFRGTFEAAASGLAIVSLDGRFLRVNRSLCEIVGYSESELLATTFQAITHPDDLDSNLDSIVRLRRGDVPHYRLEKRYIHKEGRQVWVLVSTSVVRGASGAALYFVALIDDITRRHQAEDALHRQSRLMTAILDRMGDGVVVADASGKLILFNHAAERILGFGALATDPSEWTQSYGLYLPDQATPFPADQIPLAKAIRGESVDDVEMFVRNPAKPEGVWISINARPLQDDGVHREGVVVFRDTTEKKRVEQELAGRAEELARSNAELERFAYVASHDLQEPLRMVGSFTQLLARRYRGQLDEKADRYIDFAVEGCNRMKQLIEDLLEFSRVSTNGKPFQPVDCEAVLERTLADLRVAIEESGAEVAHGPLPVVQGDATQLGQLFQNLVGNALKFRSGRPPRVRLSAERGPVEWTFRVEDNGIGIDPRYAERVFVLFQRLHTSDEYPGTGIGLALCKKIVERHGGRIWFEPMPGGGTRFLFTIPRRDLA